MGIELPKAFTDRMRAQLGRDYPAFEQALLYGQNVRGLRVNQTKISVEAYLALTPYALEQIPYASDGFYFPNGIQMGGDPGRHAGMFYLQDPSAMVPVRSVQVRTGWRVLDLCASPGGKTAQLADAVGEDGLVLANDIREGRCRRLVETVQRLGLRNVLVTMAGAPALCSRFRDCFDLALVDAPCSCEGMFRKKSRDIPYWSEDRVAECAETQKGLLEHVSGVIAPGGLLVYSTCTFSTEENEGVVEWFLGRHPEFSLSEVPKAVADATLPGFCLSGKYPMEKTRRFYPHISRGEGQYTAVLRRADSERMERSLPRAVPEQADPARRRAVERLLRETGVDIPEERISFSASEVWALPRNTVRAEGLEVLNGVCLGRWEGPELIPAHGFFSTCGAELRSRIALEWDDPRLSAYLRGEALREPLPDGWGAVTVSGCAVGGFHSKGGVQRSLYPENLRNWK